MKKLKKILLMVIYFLFSFMLSAKEFDYSVLKDKNPNLVFLENSVYSPFNRKVVSLYEKASAENQYIVQFKKYSFDYFFKEGEYADEHEQICFRETIKDNHEIPYSSYALDHDYYEEDNFFYEIQFFNYAPHLRACPIGNYLVEIFFKGFVYLFEIEDPRSCTKDEKYEAMFNELQDYVILKDIDAGSDFDRVGEMITTYCWKDERTQFQFYLDMQNKRPSLPQYVIDFQIAYEKVLNDILEYFRALSSSLVKTNLRIRQSPKTGAPIITVLEGTKVYIMETGESDVIDGIQGNWVKVKVPSLSKDKDGNLIPEEIIGWCFDGYLE